MKFDLFDVSITNSLQMKGLVHVFLNFAELQHLLKYLLWTPTDLHNNYDKMLSLKKM